MSKYIYSNGRPHVFLQVSRCIDGLAVINQPPVSVSLIPQKMGISVIVVEKTMEIRNIYDLTLQV